jgi:hypothetical protein
VSAYDRAYEAAQAGGCNNTDSHEIATEAAARAAVPTYRLPLLTSVIHAGDRVTIVDRFGKQRSGRAVMRGPAGWVLNMGGKHGTPAIADDNNTVRVTHRSN